MTPHAAMDPATALAVLTAMAGTPRPVSDTNQPCDGPDEPVIADADLEWLADREEARETRWRKSA